MAKQSGLIKLRELKMLAVVGIISFIVSACSKPDNETKPPVVDKGKYLRQIRKNSESYCSIYLNKETTEVSGYFNFEFPFPHHQLKESPTLYLPYHHQRH